MDHAIEKITFRTLSSPTCNQEEIHSWKGIDISSTRMLSGQENHTTRAKGHVRSKWDTVASSSRHMGKRLSTATPLQTKFVLTGSVSSQARETKFLHLGRAWAAHIPYQFTTIPDEDEGRDLVAASIPDLTENTPSAV